MFTPTEDYMRPIREDFSNLLIYLKKLYNVEFGQEYVIELKKIHKILWVLIVWRRYLENNNYFDDVILNVLSLIHVSVHKDLNIMNFLLRKSVEDFLRFMGKHITEIRATIRVPDAFELAFENSRNDLFLHKNWEVLKSIYSDCCQTVHSNDVIENQIPCICLKNYDTYFSDNDMRTSTNEWTKTIKCFCNIIIIYDINLFKLIPLNDQAIIRDYLSTDDLQIIF